MYYTLTLPRLTYDEAFDFTVEFLRTERGKKRIGFAQAHSYDLYLLDVAFAYVDDHNPEPLPNPQGPTFVKYQYGRNMLPFKEVAWALVTSGLLVPGGFEIDNVNGNAVYGFHLTESGQEWICSAEVAASPRRYGEFGRLLSEFDPVYGELYAIRSQEALGCFRHGNYVACCAMAGACAETILYTAYAQMKGDPEQALKDMTSAGGRGRVETALLGRLKDGPRMELQTSFSLIKYWRDNAAHGVTGRINQNEAYVALLTLLTLAQSAQRHLLDKDGNA